MRTEILNTQVYPIVEIKGVQIQLDLDIDYYIENGDHYISDIKYLIHTYLEEDDSLYIEVSEEDCLRAIDEDSDVNESINDIFILEVSDIHNVNYVI